MAMAAAIAPLQELIMTDVTEGSIAPDFELAGAAGPVRLADFKGKGVVLYFYPKDDTTGCTKEAQEFSALAPEFAKADVTVIGVSKDSVPVTRALRKICADRPARVRPRGRGHRALRVLGRKEHVRPDVYGN